MLGEREVAFQRRLWCFVRARTAFLLLKIEYIRQSLEVCCFCHHAALMSDYRLNETLEELGDAIDSRRAIESTIR
jgi:hypothetical protein